MSDSAIRHLASSTVVLQPPQSTLNRPLHPIGRAVNGLVQGHRLVRGAGLTTVLPSLLTAVCASSLPLIDAPVRSVTDV